MLCGLLNAPPSALAAPRAVVLDPGHGGSDTGAVGSGGLVEKTWALRLADTIRNREQDRFSTRLSRTGDLRLSPERRAEIANTHGGKLFLSLHAGGGFQQVPGPIRIFHPEPVPRNRLPGAPSWSSLQNRHALESRILAETLREAIRDTGISRKIEVRPAFLFPLAALDMPAVLVEFGNLASPEDELAMSDSGPMDRLARGIADGMSDYLDTIR